MRQETVRRFQRRAEKPKKERNVSESIKEVKNDYVERKALSRIPMEQRKSCIGIAFIWIGTMICIPMLMVGGLLASMMSLSGVIIAAIVGFAVCAAIMVMAGIQSTDLGLPSTMITTSSFGDKGSSFVGSLAVFIAQTGWFGVQTATCAMAFSSLMTFLGVENFPAWAGCLIWGAVMLVTAVYGFKFMAVLNYIAVPALFLLCLYGIIYAVRQAGWGALLSFEPDAASTMPMTSAISLVIGLFAVGTVINGDFTRYAKNRTATFLATFIGVVPAAVFMIFAGGIMAKGTGNYDIAAIFANIGVPVLGMIVLILATWTTNTSNAYTAGLAAMKVLNLKDEKRTVVTMVCGALGIIIAIAGLANVLTTFITILGAFIPPIAGVAIADYWIIKKGKPENWSPVKGVNFCGITAWALGGIIAKFFSFFSPALDGIIVSIVAYAVLYLAAGKTRFGGQGSTTVEAIEASLK
jgi:cytosine permease